MTNRIHSIVQLLVISILSVLIASCGDAGTTKDDVVVGAFYPTPETEWELVWSDEFDGTSLDTNNWSFQEGDGTDYGLPSGWGNSEQQWYSRANITVADGNLTISANTDNLVNGFDFTSGRIRTLGKLDMKYGRIEARISAPAGQGLWSAFWMLPSDSPYGNWASSGEIDIMEGINDTDISNVSGTLHHGFPWPLNQQYGTEPADVVADGDFHTYAIEWEENEIRWFVDGEHYMTVTSDHWYSYFFNAASGGYEQGAGGAPFDTEFHILLNLAVGGQGPGNVADVSVIPADLVVDYVRVYECGYDQADGSGCNSNVDRTMEVPDDKAPFTASYALYEDAANTLSWVVVGETHERELGIASFWDNNGALVLTEVAANDATHGTVIDVYTTDTGNFSLYALDGDPIELYGMGNNPAWWEGHAGVLSFDLYIDSANTDQASSLLVKMDSGWPALGFVTLAVADLPQDEWTTVNVNINDLLVNSGDQPLDTTNIVSLFVLEPTAAAHVQVDNISLSCGSPGSCGISAPVEDNGGNSGPMTLPGTWRIASEAGSLAVGPEAGSSAWWAIDDAGVLERACYYDDDYVFGNDGSFSNVLGADTWLEAWQGTDPDACGTPVFPHDGGNPATFSYDEGAGTLTVTGAGAYIGLAKANNAGELTDPNNAPASITYTLTVVDSRTVMLGVEAGAGVHWTYKLVKVEDAPVPPSFAGTWRVASEAGSLAVGPDAGSSAWWAIDDAGVTERACYFDDDYVFSTDGSFSNVLGAETWLEAWQGTDPDACGAPAFPHDGGNPATFSYDEGAGTLTITGAGAYIGLAKANNAGELTDPNNAPASITYNVTFVDSNTVMVGIEAGAGVHWTYKLVKVAEPSPLEGTWRVASEAGSLAVGPDAGSSDWWAIDDAGVIERACYFDDDYVFGGDGAFSNVLGAETWLEAWQGTDPDACGAPAFPHDGGNPATYAYDAEAGTLTINGAGAYIGLAKANNDGELTDPNAAPASIIYNVTFEGNTVMMVGIEAGSGVHWTYKLVKQ